MRYLAAQYIDWPDEMEQLADNISDHLNRKREQHNLQRLKRLAKKQEEQEDA
jgi:hypothetical protein